MIDGTEEVVEQLTSVAETLAELALDRLHWAADVLRGGGGAVAGRHGRSGNPGEDPVADGDTGRAAADRLLADALVAEEKVLTRARRSVDKAVQLMTRASGSDGGGPGLV